jgi:chromate reductase, NAD(P)H dehydrogenase (quinone)
MRIAGICGSLRRHSFNSAVMRAAGELLPEGVSLDVLRIDDLPFYNEDIREAGLPEAVVRFRTAVSAADAVLIVTPEYNYSVPGMLKNAIDWASRPPQQCFNEKPVALMGASSGVRGTVRAQLHLRHIMASINAHVLPKPEVMVGHAASLIGEDGRVHDEATRKHVADLLLALTKWAERLRK